MLQICVEFVLRSPEDHPIQQPQLGPDPALRERGVADPEAVGIKKPLNGVFKHLGGFRLKAVELAGVQNIRKFFFGGQSVRVGTDRLTDFFLTPFFFSSFFLT